MSRQPENTQITFQVTSVQWSEGFPTEARQVLEPMMDALREPRVLDLEGVDPAVVAQMIAEDKRA